MNINQTLFDAVSDILDNFLVDKADISDLLFQANFHDFEIRQEKACRIIEKAMSYRGKPNLFKGLVELAAVEKGIRDLQPYQRDHVVHSVLIFLLGVYLIDNIPKLKGIPAFPWSLAAFFHDVAYPIEISKRIVEKYTNVINQCSPHQHYSRLRLDPGDFLVLNNGRNSLDMINERINEWDIHLDVKKIYQDMVDSGSACHGIYSAIFLLTMLDAIYQQANPKREYKSIIYHDRDWNEAYFVGDVVSACSAIFLHNLNADDLENNIINIDKAPLAYLLKVCDILQDWERPDGNSDGTQVYALPSCLYDIEFQGSQFVFILPSSRKGKVEEELKCLKGIDILLKDSAI